LTSSIVESNPLGWGLAEYDLEEIKVPTLFVHHEKDGCDKTQASGIPRIAKKLSRAPLVEVKIVTGGKKGNPKKVCGGKSHHGYLGIEDKVVEIMASFIKTH
jgi:pimeloyl-ACP methyl ester carboxylesterase